ncbi:ATP-grasp domain-containing protein [Bradyrhizobium sp.]|uniref:ATP-grasp domain-containing protein n=1 Tax=Bradyrhizobium sp. TaxID=376 RepID=UPI00260AF687|nr:ATP-grasp domain-containing protein [Bradyrhizobium sp.]
MILVLSEDSFVDPNTINGRELRSIIDVVRMLGCRIYPIPLDFEECGTAENALAYLPEFGAPIVGVWAGYIPSVERYTAIFDAAAAKGVRLINTPAQHRTAMEFDQFYPLLDELTPKSVIVNDLDGLQEIEQDLEFPMFVRGAVKSNKDQGWAACVAHDHAELRGIADRLLTRDRRSRGKVVARRLVKFRAIATDSQSFPIGREYRAFIYGDTVLAFGFYWDEYVDSSPLSAAEEQILRALVIEAARRVGTPFLAVDVGQLETGEWIVIEVSDGQFAGLSHIEILDLWSKLANITINCRDHN